MNNLKKSIEKEIKTSDLTGKIETLQQENEDLQNRLMRSTLIFCGVPESEKKNDSWEEVFQNLVGLLVAKLNLDHYELNMQISHAYRTLKSENNSNCQPIFAQFISWRYANEVRRKLIQLHATRKSKITISQMFSKELTQQHNNVLKQRKAMLQ